MLQAMENNQCLHQYPIFHSQVTLCIIHVFPRDVSTCLAYPMAMNSAVCYQRQVFKDTLNEKQADFKAARAAKKQQTDRIQEEGSQ